MPDTDLDWKKWGRQDPYFGGLASPEYGRDQISANREAFFRSGKLFIDDVLTELARFDPHAPRDRALDHGCGTGRLTLPLSEAYRSVVAVDVSPEMLGEAERNARSAGRHNIDFRLADDRLSKVTETFDLVVSHLVLQHVPVRRGMAIFRELIGRVAPGGLFYVSVSIRNDSGPLRWLYWASAVVPGVKIVQNLLRGAKWNAPAMQMNPYPIDRLLAELSKRGVQRSLLITDAHHPRFQTFSLLGILPAA